MSKHEAFELLNEIEDLARGNWAALPRPMYLDVARAWSLYRRGDYSDAVSIATPALKMLRSMREYTPGRSAEKEQR